MRIYEITVVDDRHEQPGIDLTIPKDMFKYLVTLNPLNHFLVRREGNCKSMNGLDIQEVE